jgi:hypothetical protein
MSLSASGKTLYWRANETLDVKMTEMYKVNSFAGKDEFVVGEKGFDHFMKDPQTGKFSIEKCVGKLNGCEFCKTSKEKARMKFTTKVEFDGELRYADLQISLSREMAKMQRMLQALGKTEAEILSTVFRVKKLPSEPWWQVEIAVAGTPGPGELSTSRPPVPMEELDLDPPEPVAAEVPANAAKLTAEEVAYVKKFEKNTKANKAKNPAWDLADAVKKTLSRAGWPADKQDSAVYFFDAAGLFVDRPSLVVSE